MNKNKRSKRPLTLIFSSNFKVLTQYSTKLKAIKDTIPDVVLDIRYATTDNFTGVKIYEEPFALLNPEALHALSEAVAEFRSQGFRIVVFDAWRPEYAQKVLRQFCKDDKYVAEQPRHVTGYVIDITLADSDGQYLDMGTDYDDFSEKAHSDDKLITLEQRENRQLLREVMLSHGFVTYPYEWWDFEYIT
jgi:zinc D-Ala-D-Ala dipeptidase